MKKPLLAKITTAIFFISVTATGVFASPNANAGDSTCWFCCDSSCNSSGQTKEK